MQISDLQAFVIDKIEDMKARDIQVVDVKGKSPVTDIMIVCTGTSKTHVKSISNHLYLEAKRNEVFVMGIEGKEDSEWVLVDMGDIVVHIMQQQTRDLYQLEELWQSVGA
ncbi:ribosome silencing factor [Moritella sp.]|uniref:ribosome silencing factor n=1 Tax=Moritella sp. TaxID=78556 RepID=UPI001DA5EC75|nr:ribosome silencing factor [Moritella sp.]MCJ8351701.1 ribosome silencing factor [Moritella sp.]NQZ41740.1 ribosome silencing factor [Moritella sp.]NQZ93143.1 ribosome silencing factor [Moritella sp.]